jgi:uracil-DNA glycosylase
VSPVSTDETYDRYRDKAITEINELGDEIAHAAGESGFPVVGSGHPLADIFLFKYGPQASEAQEGVSFYGRAGQAIIKSLQRLNVDPLAVYGTNCLKFAGQKPDQARSMLVRELHIVQPKLIVVMGEDTLRFLDELDFPLSDRVEYRLGEIQRFTPTIDALVVPDIDASLDEQETKTEFWNAFKALGPWWSELPPY